MFNLHDLICQEPCKNGELAEGLLRFAMNGFVSSVFIGRSGSGKTTLCSAAIGTISDSAPIYAGGLAAEDLVTRFPQKNITVQPKSLGNFFDYTQVPLRELEKSGIVLVADEIAAASQALGLYNHLLSVPVFNLFTFYSNTADKVVPCLVNMVLDGEPTLNRDEVRETFVDNLGMVVATGISNSNMKFIKEITEVDDPLRVLVQYDEDRDEYLPVSPPSSKFAARMDSELKKEFQLFVDANW